MKSARYLTMEDGDAMHIQDSFASESAKLYLVATPIGHLADLTFRAVETLQEVAVIFAEDTRQSKKLLNHYHINTPMLSAHQHNEHARIETVIDYLKNGESVALISDAGTPLISDPGAILVREVLDAGYPVIALPGANAALTALPASGLDAEHFLFYGFLPTKTTARKRALKTLVTLPFTLIFYEAPHRIQAMMSDVHAVFGSRRCVIARELTKRFESYIRFSLSEKLTIPTIKGEMVVLVEGASPVELDAEDAIEHIDLLRADGLSEMAAIKEAAQRRNMKKNDVYMAYQRHKKQSE